MDPFSIALALAAGATSIFVNRRNQRAVNAANRMNIALQREDRDWRRESWNLQNEYNSPVAQMERLAAAGLNPILAIDKNIGVAGPVSAGSAPSVDPVLSKLDLIPNIANFMDMRQKSVQQDLMQQQKNNLINQAVLLSKKAATESLKAKLYNKDLGIKDKIAAEKQLDITRKTLENNLKTALFDSEEALFKAKLKRAQNQAKASEFMYEDARSNSEFLRNFKKYGLGPGSKWYEKWLIRGINAASEEAGNWENTNIPWF